jgi:hypothetical protein
MLASALIVIPLVLCATLGAMVGYFYRDRVQLRRVFTVGGAVLVFLVCELTSGTLSSKYSLQENLSTQLDLLGPFLILYLLPAISVSFLVARRWRKRW